MMEQQPCPADGNSHVWRVLTAPLQRAYTPVKCVKCETVGYRDLRGRTTMDETEQHPDEIPPEGFEEIQTQWWRKVWQKLGGSSD